MFNFTENFTLYGRIVYSFGFDFLANCMNSVLIKLDAEEQAMLDGDFGPARQWAMQHLIEVARFFDATDLVPVTQAHIMADTESLGEAGVRFLEDFAQLSERERRVRIPMITDPRGIDFKHYQALKQTDEMASLEQRAIDAFSALVSSIFWSDLKPNIALPKFFHFCTISLCP